MPVSLDCLGIQLLAGGAMLSAAFCGGVHGSFVPVV